MSDYLEKLPKEPYAYRVAAPDGGFGLSYSSAHYHRIKHTLQHGCSVTPLTYQKSRVLHLTLKKKWFDLIFSGEKRYEYRTIKGYFFKRLMESEKRIEWQCLDEIISDLKNPSKRHHDLADLMSYFGVSFKRFDFIYFRNGYSKRAPSMLVECLGVSVGKGIVEHGAPSCEHVFMIRIGDIVTSDNINIAPQAKDESPSHA